MNSSPGNLAGAGSRPGAGNTPVEFAGGDNIRAGFAGAGNTPVEFAGGDNIRVEFAGGDNIRVGFGGNRVEVKGLPPDNIGVVGELHF